LLAQRQLIEMFEITKKKKKNWAAIKKSSGSQNLNRKDFN
jgi:hypothetical protein